MVDGSVLAQLKGVYQTWNDTKGEGEAARAAWLSLMADNVTVTSMHGETPGLAFARSRKSRTEVVEYFTQLLTHWRMVHVTPETFVNDADQVAMFGRCAWVNRATNKPVETLVAHLWTFQAGKVVAVVELFDSAKVMAAATP